jgi:dTDP-4-dehydrorhamnose reductase
MKVLISGKNSQMGQKLFSMSEKIPHELIFIDSKLMDLKDVKCINNIINNHHPDIVINFSAYTNVDEAEDNFQEVQLINSLGPKYLAMASKQINAFFIQISTDYVFGKYDNPPFSPLSKTGPLNLYGLSKLQGEENALESNNKSIIIRTSSLYSEFGDNFVKTIAKKLINKEDLKIISDQRISMTYADDFINALIAILNEKKLDDIISTKLPSIMHYTSDGYTTWFNVANEILVNLNEYYSNLGIITPIAYSEWLSKATRPKDSRLSIDYSLLSSLNIKLNPWEFGIKEVLKRLNS